MVKSEAKTFGHRMMAAAAAGLIAVVAFFGLGLSTGLVADQPLTTQLTQDEAKLAEYIEQCIYDVTEPVIYLLGRQGGFLYSYDMTFVTPEEKIAYYCHSCVEKKIDKAFMEAELSKYVSDIMPSCVGNFDGIDRFSFGDIKTSVKINDDSVDISVDWPVAEDEVTGEQPFAQSFSKRIPLRLGHVFDVASEIVARIEERGHIDLEDMSKYDVKVALLPYDSNDQVFSIYDMTSEPPLVFNFAVRKKSPLKNSPPIIEDLRTPEPATVNENFYFRIAAYDPDGDKLTFEFDTSLFNVEYEDDESLVAEDGGRYTIAVVRFIPSVADVGIITIPVRVTDGFNEAFSTFKIDVSTGLVEKGPVFEEIPQPMELTIGE